MTIDVDVLETASRFGLDPTLVQSVVNAEGDILKAVRCSIPSAKDRADAIDILCRSLVHRLNDFVHITDPVGFVEFFAQKWAPVGVANDPHGLNANLPKNVKMFWLGLTVNA